MVGLKRALRVAWIPVAASFGPLMMVFPMLGGFDLPYPVGFAFSFVGVLLVSAMLNRMLRLELEVRRLQGKSMAFYGVEEGDDLPKPGAKTRAKKPAGA